MANDGRLGGAMPIARARCRLFPGLLIGTAFLFFNGARTAPTYAEDLVLTLDPGASRIRFVLEATLHTVEGNARLAEGTVQFDPERGSASGAVRVDARSATTGIKMRDATMHEEVLESERFPDIVFLPQRLAEWTGTSSERSLAVAGRIRIHGSEQPLTIPMEAAVDGSRVRLRGRFVIPYVAWGMKDVSTFLLRVGKTVSVHIDAAGTFAAPAGSAP